MKTRRVLLTNMVSCLALPMLSPAWAAEAPQAATGAREFFVYLGTYTGAKSKGIYVSRFDAATGKLTAPELAAETPNPTFLAIHPRLPALYSAERPLLFAANETGGGNRSGSVSAYAISRDTGQLAPLNQQSSRGAGPCHLSVDRTGRCVLVANYGSGSIAALPIQPDGGLGEATAFIQHTGSSVNRRRQEGPHAHWIDVDPANQFALACDLGLDKVLIYRLDPAKASLVANDPPSAALPPGSGPRHLAFHPNGRFAYVISELANTVTVFAYDAARGDLKALQSVATLPAGFTNNSAAAEIEVHPSGQFLYGSNRGADSIAIYRIDPTAGTLEWVGHQPTQGKAPRHFAIDPTGQWLLAANQDSDNVVVFRLDPKTGRLAPVGQTITVGKPVCVKFVPVK